MLYKHSLALRPFQEQRFFHTSVAASFFSPEVGALLKGNMSQSRSELVH